MACAGMRPLARLVTYVDAAPGPPSNVSVKARHELELGDGRRVLLFDDRGWGSTGAWTDSSVADLERACRGAVGPDEPFNEGYAQTATAQAIASVGRGRPSLTGMKATSPQVTFRVTPELRARAAAEAARQGRRISDVAREALERYLAL